jgi:hypothetical protein
MEFVHISLLPHDASWFKLITDLTPVFLFLYTVLFFWPNFIKQKRAENLSFNAKEALLALTRLENLFHEFLFMQHKGSYQQGELLKMQFKIWSALNELRNMLLLIRRDIQLHKMPGIEDLVRWIEEVRTLLHDKEPRTLSASVVHDLFSRIDPSWIHHKELSTHPLEKLRNILLKIYEYRDPRPLNKTE